MCISGSSATTYIAFPLYNSTHGIQWAAPHLQYVHGHVMRFSCQVHILTAEYSTDSEIIGNDLFVIEHCNLPRPWGFIITIPHQQIQVMSKRIWFYGHCRPNLLRALLSWSSSLLLPRIQSRQKVKLLESMSSTSAQGLTALSSTLLGLSTIAIGLRFYARHAQKVPLKSDDWITIPCLVSAMSPVDEICKTVIPPLSFD